MFRRILFVILFILVVLSVARPKSEIFVGMITSVGYVPHNGDPRGTTMVFTTQGTFVVFGYFRYRSGDGAWLTTEEDNRIYLAIQNRVMPGKVQYFRITQEGNS